MYIVYFQFEFKLDRKTLQWNISISQLPLHYSLNNVILSINKSIGSGALVTVLIFLYLTVVTEKCSAVDCNGCGRIAFVPGNLNASMKQ